MWSVFLCKGTLLLDLTPKVFHKYDRRDIGGMSSDSLNLYNATVAL